MTDSVEPLLITSSDAAKLLCISPRTLWEMTKNRKIPCIRLGRSVRYSVEDLRKWLAEHSCPQK